MTGGRDYLPLLQKILRESKEHQDLDVVQEIRSNSVSLFFQVRKMFQCEVQSLRGMIEIAADEQLLYPVGSTVTDSFLRLNLERLGLSCHE